MSDPRGRFVTLTRESVTHLRRMAHCLPQRVSPWLDVGSEFSSFQKQNRL